MLLFSSLKFYFEESIDYLHELFIYSQIYLKLHFLIDFELDFEYVQLTEHIFESKTKMSTLWFKIPRNANSAVA